MKKKLFCLIVAAFMLLSVLPAGALAQGRNAVPAENPSVREQTVIASWDFETDPETDGWQFIDSDGDGFNWEWVANAVYSHSGDYCIASASYSGGALTPDNWAVLPQVEIPAEGDCSLRLYGSNQSGYYFDTYRIYVGTSADIESMQPLTDDMTLPGTEYSEQVFDLSEYAGQTVSIAIRHYNCEDEWRFYFDDVSVVTGEPDPNPPAEEGLIAGYYFEGDAPLEGWTIIGTGNTEWVHSDDNPGSYNYASLAHEGTGFILSYSFVDYVGSYQADNWAITPAVELPEGSASVSFYATNANASYPEAFDLYIGNSDDTAAMTLLQGNISPNSGYQDPWTRYEFDLSDYAGQTIYLAFYDHCYDMYEIWIDQVELWGEANEEPGIIGEIAIENFVAPEWGAEPNTDITVPDGAHYQIHNSSWSFVDEDGTVETMPEGALFDNPDYAYRMAVLVTVEEGWSFAPAEELVVTVNGETENVLTVLTMPGDIVSVVVIGIGDFTVEEPGDDDPYAIHEVYVDGWGSPVEGVVGIDHFFLTTPEGAPYFIAAGGWRDETDQQQMWNETHIFIAGHEYSEGCMIMAEDGYYFADDCAFYADGGTDILDMQWCYVEEGNWICYMNSIPVVCEGTSGLLGDVDNDGDVDTADALMALRYAMGLIDLNEAQLAQGEVDGDGSVTIIDSLLIARKAMELIPAFPIED